MTTSDRKGAPASARSSTVRLVVLAVIVGAVAFGLYIAYLGWTNDSFPTKTEPFGGYASVTSYSFNGTEFAFTLSWANASAIPLKAQLTSPATDAANTPVCQVGLSKVQNGQEVFMPFTISPASATLSNVDLNIDVQPLAGGGDFAIIYNVAAVSATNVPITPSTISCQQPLGSY